MKSFKLVGAVSNVLSNPEIFRVIGNVCSYVVLFLISRILSDSVRLETCLNNLQKLC